MPRRAWIPAGTDADGRIPSVSPAIAAAPVRVVFFDLDGTLVDPAGGITSGIAHALSEHGLSVPSQAQLDALVGPPLAMGLAGMPGIPAESIPSVVESYRAWYLETGMGLSRVYPGIEDALRGLRAAGAKLAVTTLKPQPTAERLLALHGLDAAFDAVVGPDLGHVPLDGHDKAPLVLRAARAVDVEPTQGAVVGDRRYDLDAAHAVGAAAIGVRWGFAEPGELEACEPAAVLSTASELLPTLIGGSLT